MLILWNIVLLKSMAIQIIELARKSPVIGPLLFLAVATCCTSAVDRVWIETFLLLFFCFPWHFLFSYIFWLF
jgi:hypothetical protein